VRGTLSVVGPSIAGGRHPSPRPSHDIAEVLSGGEEGPGEAASEDVDENVDRTGGMR
jgi:hypothetical protein